ncbi:MAG: dGTP triphosphohydrolase [Verrucomicrobiales bacterium]
MSSNRFYQDFDRESRGGGSRRADEYRSPFQVDRDRIIHTSAFRRLQSKTQVFLSGEYDFYRTRLTHSIEVAQIGRSICASLQAKSVLLGGEFYIDSDLVEAACLAHDIGHPPFGHTGERTLNALMREHGGFEGNAQTLRLLTETIFSGQNRGMDPTRALLDAVLKYRTLHRELDDPENHFLYDEQQGDLDFVYAGAAFPAELEAGSKRDAFRSIECEIMDWADDTAYSLNDLADGVRAGFITLEGIERWGSGRELAAEECEHLDYLRRAIREDRVEAATGRKIGDFIASCELVEEQSFFSDRTRRHGYRLRVEPSVQRESQLYKKLALDLVFASEKLQQLDFKTDYVLRKLFAAFAETYLDAKPGGRVKWNLLPANTAGAVLAEQSEGRRLRLLCDHLAAMTDGQALRTYRRLFEPDFGSIADLG